MRRLTHQQYTRISMLESELVPHVNHDDHPGLYVDTWKPPVNGDESAVRVSIIAEEAVIAGPGAEHFAEFVLNLDICSDGTLIDEDGAMDLGTLNPTITDIRGFLADRFSED